MEAARPRLRWLWILLSSITAIFHIGSRAAGEIRDLVGDAFLNWLVSDGYAAYWSFQICGSLDAPSNGPFYSISAWMKLMAAAYVAAGQANTDALAHRYYRVLDLSSMWTNRSGKGSRYQHAIR